MTIEPEAGWPAPNAEAEIYFLSPTEGGRTIPPRSGYRGQFEYDGDVWDSLHVYPDEGRAVPGTTVRTSLTFTKPEVHRSRIYVGMPFTVSEGATLIGRGVITKILDM